MDVSRPVAGHEGFARSSAANTAAWYWWREPEALLLLVLAFVIYGSRLTSLPSVGEESRWARGAVHMIESGDWIVPRQQGLVFPERPPLSSWSMALVGIARGEVDLVAVRLPSVIATALTALLIYAYTRAFWTRLAALAAGAAYLTLGQVLVLGRAGESEALFTLFVASSLLIWHVGYARRWPSWRYWSAGYTCAALGALTKGPQAPIYFVAVVVVYLTVRRDWRTLLGPMHALGLATFALLVGAWQVPFYVMAGPSATWNIWTGLAGDRFSTHRLLAHAVSYPFETFGCLLPWSVLALGLLHRRVRAELRDQWPKLQFVLVALAATYPTVWLAAGARGRYFMPLYPCAAVVLGVLAERYASLGRASQARATWQTYWSGIAITAVASSVVILVATFVDVPLLTIAGQPPAFAIAFAAVAIGFSAVLAAYVRWPDVWRPQLAVVGLTCFLGLAYSGAVMNARIAGGNDLSTSVAGLKDQLPTPDHLVSFGSLYHRFAYYYGQPIKHVEWPRSPDDVPEDVTYFCFDVSKGDTPQLRAGGDGRQAIPTPGTLPFAWDEVARIACDPERRDEPVRTVVIGRIRARELLVTEATPLAPKEPATTNRVQPTGGRSGVSRAAYVEPTHGTREPDSK